MMNQRKVRVQGNEAFSFFNIPVPFIRTMKQPSSLEEGLIKGITEPYFDKLNNTEVQLVGKVALKKRKAASDGSFLVDTKGNVLKEDIHVPKGSVAVLSPIPIGLKRFVENDKGLKVEVKLSEGFKYVDFIEKDGKRKYIYIIPKQYVYKLNLCALVVTPSKHKVFYKGCRLALQNGNYLYMYVIPFKAKHTGKDYRVLGVKSTYNFDAEVETLLRYWYEQKVIFNLSLTRLENAPNGVSNLGLIELENTLSTDDYYRYTEALNYVADEFEDLEG